MSVGSMFFADLKSLFLIQEMPAAVVDGHDQVTGHIISTTIGGKNGEPKQVILR